MYMSIYKSLMSYIEEKKKKKMVYMWLAQIQNLKISYVCTEHEVVSCECRAMQEKIPNKKRHHEWVDVFLIFQLMIIVSGLYLG